MRIAFSGGHRVGKSTLIEQIRLAIPGFICVDEPYYLLEEDGYEFAWPPSTEDFRAQLERSIAEVERSGERTIFDRCPADLLAYLIVDGADIDTALDSSLTAMGMLDLVVLVPIEDPDLIAVPTDEDLEQRRAVAQVLETLLLDDSLAHDVIEVRGDIAARAEQVMAAIESIRTDDRG